MIYVNTCPRERSTSMVSRDPDVDCGGIGLPDPVQLSMEPTPASNKANQRSYKPTLENQSIKFWVLHASMHASSQTPL
jgi:hypothetical protein